MGARKPPPSRDEWRVFGWWAVVGIGSIWATWTLLSYGWVIAIITTVGALGLASREEPGRSAWGFVTGMGVVPLWIWWVNRGADAPALSPWVWMWTGACLVLVGVLIFVRPRRQTPDPQDPPPLG